jgi:hypothetical protein
MILMGADLRAAAGIDKERTGTGGISADVAVGAGLEDVFDENLLAESIATRATRSCAIRSSWICRWRRNRERRRGFEEAN